MRAAPVPLAGASVGTHLGAPALQHAPPLVLLAALRPLKDGDWQAVAMSLVEAALFVGLNETLRRRPAVYLRHRSLLLSLVFLGHFTASAPAADCLMCLADCLMCAWLADMSMQPACAGFGPPWLPPVFVLAAPRCLLASG